MLRDIKISILKHKKIILSVSVLILLAIPIIEPIKVCRKIYHEYLFERVLKEARKIDPDLWYHKYAKADLPIRNDYKVVIVTNNGGEMTFSEYFRYAAEKKGWKVKIFNSQLLGHEDEVLKFDPDFILFTCHVNSYLDSRINAHHSKKYSLNFISFQQMLDSGGIDARKPLVLKGNPGLLSSIVHGIITVAPELQIYEKMWKKLGKKFEGFRMFPLVPYFDFAPAEPKNLMWLSGGWDTYRSSDTYRSFIKKLSETVPMKVYGHFNAATYLKPGVYDGYVTPGVENITAIRKNGIYLLTHSNFHFKGLGVPSMRVFEATAANAVVISDMHQFPREHFGDNFLYFDHTKSAEEIYTQIKAHVDWILKNPEKAKAMSNRAHQIFLEKFCLEGDLVRIAKMHEYILDQEQKMNLSYPLGY